MKKTIFILFILTFLLLGVFAQKTIIKGITKGATGKTIRVITYTDQISYLEKTIAKASINENGKFNLEFDLQNTVFSYLAINFQRAEFYIEPGKKYNLEISYDTSQQQYSFVEPVNLSFQIKNPVKNELNNLIQNLNIIYNDFVFNNFNNIYKKHQKYLVDTLRKRIDRFFSGITNEYFENYIKYKLASVEQFAKLKNTESLIKTYFINQPILYNNIEYMDFFNNLFTRYLMVTSGVIKYQDLIETINEKASYDDFKKVIDKDDLLKNSGISELVLLKGLNELYYTQGFKRKNILKILKEISNQSNSKQNRLIANDLIITLTKLSHGTPAPDFTLKDNNNEISLSDFNGKYVYLNFWNTQCKPCIDDIKIIEELKTKFGGNIEFINISTDNELIQLQEFLALNNYSLVFLHYDNKMELLENYNIKTFPSYILIDNQGNILKCPAPKPDANLENYFWELLNIENSDH